MTEIREEHVVEQVESAGAYPNDGRAAPAAAGSAAVTRRSSVNRQVSGVETTRRIIIMLFGIIQAIILLRFALLLLDARHANDLVAGILSFSQIFVGPFEGIFRTDALSAGGSVFELASITAIVAWTLIEFAVLAVLRIVTRQPEGTRI